VPQSNTSNKACLLVLELLLLQDLGAESDVLHGVRVVSTLNSSRDGIFKQRFDPDSVSWMEKAMDYWKLRLMCVNLALKLSTMWPSLFDIDHLTCEQERLASTLLMTLPEYDQYVVMMTHTPDGPLLALLALYGAMMDRTLLRNTPSAFITDWIVQQVRLLMPQFGGSVKMDQVQASADMFMGGPVAGVLANGVGWKSAAAEM
jgi:hypothetical protein